MHIPLKQECADAYAISINRTHHIYVRGAVRLLKRRLNQTTRISEDNNEKAYKIGYAEGMLNLCMKVATIKSENEMKELNSSDIKQG